MTCEHPHWTVAGEPLTNRTWYVCVDCGQTKRRGKDLMPRESIDVGEEAMEVCVCGEKETYDIHYVRHYKWCPLYTDPPPCPSCSAKDARIALMEKVVEAAIPKVCPVTCGPAAIDTGKHYGICAELRRALDAKVK